MFFGVGYVRLGWVRLAINALLVKRGAGLVEKKDFPKICDGRIGHLMYWWAI